MTKKKACKRCKLFFEGETCPSCGTSQGATSWQGRMYFMSIEKSDIAKKIGIEKIGEYAIKVR